MTVCTVLDSIEFVEALLGHAELDMLREPIGQQLTALRPLRAILWWLHQVQEYVVIERCALEIRRRHAEKIGMAVIEKPYRQGVSFATPASALVRGPEPVLGPQV